MPGAVDNKRPPDHCVHKVRCPIAGHSTDFPEEQKWRDKVRNNRSWGFFKKPHDINLGLYGGPFPLDSVPTNDTRYVVKCYHCADIVNGFKPPDDFKHQVLMINVFGNEQDCVRVDNNEDNIDEVTGEKKDADLLNRLIAKKIAFYDEMKRCESRMKFPDT